MFLDPGAMNQVRMRRKENITRLQQEVAETQEIVRYEKPRAEFSSDTERKYNMRDIRTLEWQLKQNVHFPIHVTTTVSLPLHASCQLNSQLQSHRSNPNPIPHCSATLSASC